LTTKILPRFKMAIKRYVMIPSKGGCFELTVGGTLVYSKLKTGQFPNEDELLRSLEKLINK
jgi:selenoprotein W-related protein